MADEAFVGGEVSRPHRGDYVRGERGAGGVLLPPVACSQSRKGCLSMLSCGRPGAYVCASQKRDESGVDISSITAGLVVYPAELELCVREDDPRAAAYALASA